MNKREKKVVRRKTKKGEEGSKEIFKNVEFNFYSPNSNEVYLAGEFNDWDIQSLPMRKDEDGVWRTEIKLIPGRYEYKYFADGNWVEDISGTERVPNRFGTQNFVISVK